MMPQTYINLVEFPNFSEKNVCELLEWNPDYKF